MDCSDQRAGGLLRTGVSAVFDNLFLLEDGTYAIVDYESVYKKANKIKYLNYIARVMEKYFKEDETFNLRLIVIYTSDVQCAEPTLETDCFTLRTEQAFLSHIDGEAAFDAGVPYPCPA